MARSDVIVTVKLDDLAAETLAALAVKARNAALADAEAAVSKLDLFEGCGGYGCQHDRAGDYANVLAVIRALRENPA